MSKNKLITINEIHDIQGGFLRQKAEGVFRILRIEPQHDGLFVVVLTCGRGVTFQILSQVAELFGSKDINVGDYEPGCDTCGHGSHWEVYVLNVDSHPPLTKKMIQLDPDEMSILRVDPPKAISMISARLKISGAFAERIANEVLSNLKKS